MSPSLDLFLFEHDVYSKRPVKCPVYIKTYVINWKALLNSINMTHWSVFTVASAAPNVMSISGF